MKELVSIDEVLDAQWDQLTDEAALDDVHLSLQSLIAAARSDAALAKLYPFVSMGRLCFSRCTDFPYYVDVLISPKDPVDEKYLVEITIGRGGWVDTIAVHEVSRAKDAANSASSILPKGYGYAR